jgi:protein involved in polysaccharide export with SLBB domain
MRVKRCGVSPWPQRRRSGSKTGHKTARAIRYHRRLAEPAAALPTPGRPAFHADPTCGFSDPMKALRFLPFLAALCLFGTVHAQSTSERDSVNAIGAALSGQRATPGMPGQAGNAASGGGALPSGAPQLQSPEMNPLNLRQGSQSERAADLQSEWLLQRMDRTPAKPGEFQKFVEGATGRMLPIFGARFFADATDAFLPAGNVPVAGDYHVGPGDEVVVRAWGSIDIDYRTKVDRNGMLNLPKIGSFNVAGVKASDLEKSLRAQIGRLYNNFNLSVSLGQLRAVKVFVVGPAQYPGVYTLPSQATLLSALVAAGGPAPNGSMRKISLRRDGRIVSELDVYDFLVNGDKSKDIQLQAGDVVVFQPAGPRVALNGALDKPAIYELKSDEEPMSEIMRYAGGVPVLANPHKVQLERIDPTRQRAARYVEEFSLDAAGLQKPLRDGDVLTLLGISPQFANAITLKGHVAQPLRYPYTPGMRIRDLIPDPQALISPDFYRRKNLLVQVMEDDEPQPRGRFQRQPPPRNDNGQSDALRDVRDAGAPMEGRDARDSAASRSVDAQGAGRRRGVVGLPNDANDTRSRGQMESPRNAREENRLAAERAKKTPAALFDELNWDYAVIERLNPKDLSTEVIPFNLGKVVLQGDQTNNLLLQPGDVVTVYSQKDIRVPVARQTRLVSLEGEVNSPGIYQLLPGETLKDLITRAGGLTPQAYVYGLEFSREDTRQRQRENLATAIARLESISAVQSARDAANRRDDASAAAAAAVSNAATQAQVARLQRIEPNGRIALEIDPKAANIDALPDLPLENADRISVPPRPGFVTVAGAVVNSNAFVWRPDRTAGDYLKLAGTDEAADPSNMFILRADGTVTHANQRRGLFGGGRNLEGEAMYPGDALFVPNQLDYETWGHAFVRNLKDFSQIFSGFGIGIAAIHAIQQ